MTDICKSNSSPPPFPGVPVPNWYGDIPTIAEQLFIPATLQDVVSVIAEAHERGKRVRAVGSMWSYGDIAAPLEWTIQTHKLSRHLTSLIDLGKQISTQRVHVEGGIKIHALNELLESHGMELPTLGGSGGQSVAGATATGTHGGDIAEATLSDLIVALHVVGDAGREYWIEGTHDPVRAESVVVEDSILRQHLCPGLTIIRSTQTLNAARVNLGRLGVVYSIVLRTQPLSHLEERSVKVATMDLIGALESSASSLDPIKPLRDILPQEPSLRSLNITIPTNSSANCIVTGRFTIQKSDPVADTVPPSILCNRHVVASLGSTILLALDVVIGGIVAALPIVGVPLSVLTSTSRSKILLAINDPSTTGGKLMALALSELWGLPFGSEAIPAIAEAAFDGQFGPSLDGNARRGVSHRILTGEASGEGDDCFRANSLEFVFDSSDPNLYKFLRLVCSLTSGLQQSGYIAVRYSRPSAALLSMHNGIPSLPGNPQRYKVAVEVASLKELRDTDAWLRLVDTIASRFCGNTHRPHWGQRNSLSRDGVDEKYGDLVDAWREEVMKTAPGPTFGNIYTTVRGLEPSTPTDAAALGGLVMYQATLESIVGVYMYGRACKPSIAVLDAAPRGMDQWSMTFKLSSSSYELFLGTDSSFQTLRQYLYDRQLDRFLPANPERSVSLEGCPVDAECRLVSIVHNTDNYYVFVPTGGRSGQAPRFYMGSFHTGDAAVDWKGSRSAVVVDPPADCDWERFSVFFRRGEYILSVWLRSSAAFAEFRLDFRRSPNEFRAIRGRPRPSLFPPGTTRHRHCNVTDDADRLYYIGRR